MKLHIILSTLVLGALACEPGHYLDHYTGTCQPCRVCSEREQTLIECTATMNTACLSKNWFDQARARNSVQSKTQREDNTVTAPDFGPLVAQDSRAQDTLLVLGAVLLVLVTFLGITALFCARARRHVTWMKLSSRDDVYVLPMTSESDVRVVNTYVKIDQVT